MPYTKINSKWIKDLRVRPKTLRRKYGSKASQHWIGSDVLIITPKAQTMKEKVNKLDFMKIFKNCASKDSISGVKRQPIEWEKILVNYISDKEIICRIYREILKLNNKNQTT